MLITLLTSNQIPNLAYTARIPAGHTAFVPPNAHARLSPAFCVPALLGKQRSVL